jgi:hypothetical protein
MQPLPLTTRVRIVFVFAAALLIAQSLFIRRYGEPYPAIVMPGFQGSGGYQDGQVELSSYEAVFVTEGEEFSFPPKVLLEEFPDGHHGAIAFTCLWPRSEPPQGSERGSRFARLTDVIFPGYAARRTSRDSPEHIASLQDWLHSRARALLPDRQVSRVEIRWFRERVRVDGSEFHAEREPTGTLLVPLDAGAR